MTTETEAGGQNPAHPLYHTFYIMTHWSIRPGEGKGKTDSSVESNMEGRTWGFCVSTQHLAPAAR